MTDDEMNKYITNQINDYLNNLEKLFKEFEDKKTFLTFMAKLIESFSAMILSIIISISEDYSEGFIFLLKHHFFNNVNKYIDETIVDVKNKTEVNTNE